MIGEDRIVKTVIVCYSLTGNTAWAARCIAKTLDAEVLELRPCKAYPDRGVKKFLWGGKSAMMSEQPALEPYAFDAGRFDCVVLATPLWAGRIAPPLRSFLAEHGGELSDKRLGAVVCCSGGRDTKAFAQIREFTRREDLVTLRLVDPKDRPKPGNEVQIDAFCRALTGEDVDKEETK